MELLVHTKLVLGFLESSTLENYLRRCDHNPWPSPPPLQISLFFIFPLIKFIPELFAHNIQVKHFYVKWHMQKKIPAMSCQLSGSYNKTKYNKGKRLKKILYTYCLFLHFCFCARVVILLCFCNYPWHW